MIEIIILGTACMQPTKNRNHIGILLKYKNENILFDCGENIQRQLRIAEIRPTKITRIFISHWHGDHVLGLPGLMSSMGADQFSDKLYIYGPKGTKKYMEHMLKAFLSKNIIEHEVIEIDPKERDKERMNFPDFFIDSRKTEHGTESLGYVFLEKDRRRIKPAYVKNIPGPLLGDLQKGITIEYQNKKITPEEATQPIKGKKIAIILDTRPCENFLKLADHADLLITEATFLEAQKEKAAEYFHMTAKEAGMLANQASVKKLVLLHFSPRYKEISEIREEAKEVFTDVTCAEDFMRFKL